MDQREGLGQVLVARRLHRRLSPDQALAGISATVSRGECLTVIGPAGSGKTVLLSLFAGLDEPDSGSVSVAGHVMSYQSKMRRSALRGTTIGLLHQHARLRDDLTVAQNIVAARHRTNRRAYQDLGVRLAAMNLTGQGNALPEQLSAGQQARARLAVALANDPPLVIADDPAAGLEPADELEIFGLLRAQADQGAAVVLAGRGEQIAGWGTAVLRLGDVAQTSGPRYA